MAFCCKLTRGVTCSTVSSPSPFERAGGEGGVLEPRLTPLALDLDDALFRFLLFLWCVTYPQRMVSSCGELNLCRGAGVSKGNLANVTFNIGIIESPEVGHDCWAAFEDGVLVSKDSYSQYILSLLQEVLRFNVEFVCPKGQHPWKALKRLLADNLTDVAICHWLPSERLSSSADFLFSTLDTTEAFVYLPQNLPLTDDVFLETLSRKLWIFFVIAILLLIVSFRFSTSMHSRVRPDHEPWSWDEVVLWAIAAISQQSFSRHPRGSSCRTMFLIGYLITYLIYTGFAAGITSLLALQGHQNQLSFDDVFGMKLQLLLHRDDAFADFFEGPGSRFKYLNFQNNEGESLAGIFSQIKQTNFVGFGSTLNLLNYLRRTADPRELEGFHVVPIPHSTLRKSFLVRKNFPQKKLFDYWLLRLRETGLLSVGETRYLRKDEVGNYRQAKWSSADLRNVFSAVLFLMGGWFLSAVVLVAELLWNKFSRQRHHQRG